MPEPPRSEGGHRIYSEDHLSRLTFIRPSPELWLAVGRVRGLLAAMREYART